MSECDGGEDDENQFCPGRHRDLYIPMHPIHHMHRESVSPSLDLMQRQCVLISAGLSPPIPYPRQSVQLSPSAQRETRSRHDDHLCSLSPPTHHPRINGKKINAPVITKQRTRKGLLHLSVRMQGEREKARTAADGVPAGLAASGWIKCM